MRVVGGGNIGRVDSRDGRDSSMVVAVVVGGREAVGQVSGISLSLSISRPLAKVVDIVKGMRIVGGGNIGRVDSRDGRNSSMVVAVVVGGREAVGQVSRISLSLSISRPLEEVTTVEAIEGV